MLHVDQARGRLRRAWALIYLLALVVGGAAGYWLVRRWLVRRAPAPETRRPEDLTIASVDLRLKGLTQDEAARRMPQVDLEALARADERQFLFKAIRQNLFTTFNIDLFAIAIVMLLLGSPWSTIGTIFVLVLNLAMNVFQEVYTKKKLDQLLTTLRPQATVIRDGKIRSIDPAQIVKEDLLVVGQGDQILVDGELVGGGEITVEEMSADARAQQAVKRAGDLVRSNSFCISGRGVYRADEAGSRTYLEPPGSKLQLLFSEMTPFERLIETVLRGLFGLVVVFAIYLVVESLILQVDLISAEYRNAFSLVFSIAPTSLFFVLIIQYAMGTLRMSERGALVYKSQTIEALSNVSALCLSNSSLSSGVKMTLEPVTPPTGYEPLSENLIRRILGDAIHSAPLITRNGRVLAEALPGTAHSPLEIAPFFPKYGWYALTFDEPDLRGTFVLGDPQVLTPNLVREKGEIVKEMEQTVSQVQQKLGPWFQRITRRGKPDSGQAARDGAPRAEIGRRQQAHDNKAEAGRIPGLGQRLLARMDALLTPLEERGATEEASGKEPGQRTFLAAYLADPVPLYDRKGLPRLPAGLIPLANLQVANTIRPEARETIQKLLGAGARIKILAADSPEQVIVTARSLGLAEDMLTWTSGPALDRLDAAEFSQTVSKTTVFGNLSPSQQAIIIQSLRSQGESVAMVGNDAGDVPAMRQADVRLAMRSGAQAALMQTDIVLLRDSMDALPSVLTTGQRLVSGVLDTFNLYLSQVIMQLIMILAVLILGIGHFPFYSTQGSVLSAFTIAIPNIVLSAWSAAGRLNAVEIRRRLARFIFPSAITMVILAFGVYALFQNRPLTGSFPAWFIEYQEITDLRLFYAQMAVTTALLLAGWLRVIFLQPPTRFWTGGAPLRGDRRVVGLVGFSAGLFLALSSIPLLQKLLYITWLPSIADYLLVAVLVIVWAVVLRAIWRLRLMAPLISFFVSWPNKYVSEKSPLRTHEIKNHRSE